MSDADGTIERQEVILDELAKLGLSLARELHRRASEAEDPDTAARLAMAFHHVSRSVRQTLALQARLARELARARREDRDDAQAQDKALRQRRLDQVAAGVQRLIWTEAEPDEMAGLYARLQLHLGPEMADADLLCGPVEARVRRLCERLGLKLPPAPAADDAGAFDAPDPAPRPALRRSSA